MPQQAGIEVAPRAHEDWMRTAVPELLSPLSTIQSLLELVIEGSGEDNLTASQKRRLSDAQGRVGQLIKAVCRISGRVAESGIEAKVTAEAVELCHVVDRAVWQLGTPPNGCVLRSRVSDPTCILLCDVRLISRVLVNLLRHCARLAPAGATLSLVTSTRENTVELKVAVEASGHNGNGAGRFSTENPGKGLPGEHADCGSQPELVFCNHVIEAYGGRITAMKPPGKGFILRCELPRASRIHPGQEA